MLEESLRRVDRILLQSGTQARFVQWSLEALEAKAKAEKFSITPRLKAAYFEQSVIALRCNILRTKLQISFRELSCHLAQSPLARWFCQLPGDLERVRVPSKSQLHRYESWLPEEKLRSTVQQLLDAATADESDPMRLAGKTLENTISLETIWADATCVQPTIHFPTDWILLRDIVRTLTKAIICIRAKGLIHRMPAPEDFARQMNRYAIAMSQARRKADAKKQRKSILRSMKKLTHTVQEHAQRYRSLLDKNFAKAQLSRGQADVILRRIDNMLAQLPDAIAQAHERIIGERQVANEAKILSVYEPDIHVIVRGKAGADVEFGNTLYLAEQKDGLIVDWSLEKDFIKQECLLIAESLNRLDQTVGVGKSGKVKKLVYDRGGGTKQVAKLLEERGVINGTCPRSPALMKEKMASEDFAADQRRRGQTEGRIGILKNNFLGGRMKGQGITSRQRIVAWAVMTHNLFKVADMGLKQEAAAKKLAARVKEASKQKRRSDTRPVAA
jgi:hypothetical protein